MRRVNLQEERRVSFVSNGGIRDQIRETKIEQLARAPPKTTHQKPVFDLRKYGGVSSAFLNQSIWGGAFPERSKAAEKTPGSLTKSDSARQLP